MHKRKHLRGIMWKMGQKFYIQIKQYVRELCLEKQRVILNSHS